MDEKITYEQAVQQNRYFLNWRQAMFAGYMAILFGTWSLALQACEKAPRLMWPVLAASALIALLFIVAELRNRECYHRAAQVAKAIELGDRETHGPKDLYGSMEVPPRNWPRGWMGPHSLAVIATYAIFAVGLSISAVHFYQTPLCK